MLISCDLMSDVINNNIIIKIRNKQRQSLVERDVENIISTIDCKHMQTYKVHYFTRFAKQYDPLETAVYVSVNYHILKNKNIKIKKKAPNPFNNKA